MKMTAVKLATEACVAEKERLLNEYPVEQPAAAPADERTTTFDEWLERYVTETGGRVFPPDALRACWHASAAAANDTGAEGAEPQPSFDERKEFEAWARDQGYSIYGDPQVRDAYGGATQSAWRGWMGRSRLTDGRAVTLLRQARDELSNIEWENDPPDRIYALFGDIDKYVSGSPAMAAAAPADERAALDESLRGEIAYQLQVRNRFLDMATTRAIVDSAFNAAIAKRTLPGSRAAASPAASIPDGYALVPKRITAEMIESAMEHHYGKRRARQNGGAGGIVMTVNDTDWSGIDAMRRLWKGALAAAPQPAQVDALDEEQRDALNEAICWANDDGLPGTADQLRSILALHAQADAPAEAREPLNEVLFGNDESLEMAADALDRLGQDSAAAGVRAVAYELRMLAHKMRCAPADAGEPIGQHDLSTSTGGRAYIAEFFAKRLRRHDFGRYITGQLAADFACALAAYLRDHDRAPAEAGETVTAAARDVLAERRRQVEVEAMTPAGDDQYDRRQLALAGASYALSGAGAIASDRSAPVVWPWSHEWWKPTTPRRDLVKAAALILAELERLDRAVILNGADQ
ncbi:hypothetical protein WJ68_35430 [Burkholderia ubonensis]|uniref:Uncharacterized protein n=2 Tax=Burkholderia ubonensis TaxID=101571 RepID=A0ABD4EAW4_9BURK|nr:hypothetical protein WJ68_35430 [Burkholderia ubonensis]